MIEAAGLSKRFGGLTAVDDVSFSVEAGSVVGFLGPNGAGKSTTIRLLTGYLAADAGQARICGHEVSVNDLEAKTRVGYLPEAAAGFGNLTVKEFLTFCGESRGCWGSVLRSAIAHTCDDVALTPAINRQMKTLSKGWRQRAWLAQAILLDPPVLILDEPTDGLDPNQKDHVNALIRSKAEGKAILVSTHILEEVNEVCDRVIMIADGRVVADDTPENFVRREGSLSTAFRRLTAGSAAGESINK